MEPALDSACPPPSRQLTSRFRTFRFVARLTTPLPPRPRRFSSSGRSRILESETILLEKKLAEMRTVKQVDREQMDSRLTSKSSKFIWQGGRVSFQG